MNARAGEVLRKIFECGMNRLWYVTQWSINSFLGVGRLGR
jgi:hypothetical protein